MATKKKSTTTKKTTATRRTTNARSCRPSHRISHAGHLLALDHNSEAGHILATSAKAEKAKRKKKGCLNGVKRQGKSFELTAKQKKKLPLALQKAIIAYHKGR